MCNPTLSKEDIAVLRSYREIMSRPEIVKLATESCTTDRANGSLDSISISKGGRVWLSGEWQLCELDALCQHLRQYVIDGGNVPDDFISTLLEEDT